MKVSQIRLCFTCMLAICSALGACSGMDSGLATVTSVSSDPGPTSTRRLPTATVVSPDPEPTKTKRVLTATATSPVVEVSKTRQALTLTRQPPTVAITCRSSDDIRLVQITEEYVHYVYWSASGESVIYGTGYDEQGRRIKTWWEYSVGRDDLHRIDSPSDIDDQVLEQLGVKGSVQISPSGEYVLYMRVSPGYENYTPAPDDGPWGPPVEVRAARSDGSQAWKLYGPDGSCRTLGDAIWFDGERQVIFDCGYEGPSMVLVAQLDGSSVTSLRAMTVFTDSKGYAGMALSPDETMLAVTGTLGKLQVVPLDGSDVRHVARYGFSPSWSLDSRRVYYMRTEKEWGDYADIYMYDLGTGTDTEILSSPLCTVDGTEIYMDEIPLAVSPLEDAAAFQASGSLWLVTWSR